MTDQTNAPSGANDLPYTSTGEPDFAAMSPEQLDIAHTLVHQGRLTTRRPVARQPNQWTPKATPPRPKDMTSPEDIVGMTMRINDRSTKHEVKVGGSTSPGVLGTAVDLNSKFHVNIDSTTNPDKVIVKVPIGSQLIEMRLARALELGAVSRSPDGSYVDNTNMAAVQEANARSAQMQFSPATLQAVGTLGELTRNAGIQGFSNKLIAAFTTGRSDETRRLAGELHQKAGVAPAQLLQVVSKIGEDVFVVLKGHAMAQGLDPEEAASQAIKHPSFGQAVRYAVNGGSTEGLLHVIDQIKKSGKAVLNTGLKGRLNKDGSVSVGGLGVTTGADFARRLGVKL